MPSFEDPLDYFLRKFIRGWRGRGLVANALLTVVFVLFSLGLSRHLRVCNQADVRRRRPTERRDTPAAVKDAG